jgi:hypothetical protein
VPAKVPPGWWTITCNGIPVWHCGKPKEAQRYATDPEHRARLVKPKLWEKSMAADKGWSRRFDEPIPLPGGGKPVTLKDAIAWLAKEVPKSEHSMKEVQAAAHCVTEAAEKGGPMRFARMGMMQAINRIGTKPPADGYGPGF